MGGSANTCCFLNGQPGHMYLVEHAGKFKKILSPGFHCLGPLDHAFAVNMGDRVADISVETSTSDDVRVRIHVAVSYRVMPARVRDTHYKISNPEIVMESDLSDCFRSTVPKFPLANLLAGHVPGISATDTLAELAKQMEPCGYQVFNADIRKVDCDEDTRAAALVRANLDLPLALATPSPPQPKVMARADTAQSSAAAVHTEALSEAAAYVELEGVVPRVIPQVGGEEDLLDRVRELEEANNELRRKLQEAEAVVAAKDAGLLNDGEYNEALSNVMGVSGTRVRT